MTLRTMERRRFLGFVLAAPTLMVGAELVGSLAAPEADAVGSITDADVGSDTLQDQRILRP